jgi:hypothetical protein
MGGVGARPPHNKSLNAGSQADRRRRAYYVLLSKKFLEESGDAAGVAIDRSANTF